MAAKETTPAFRRLRGYAFDPSLSLRLDTRTVNKITYKVHWEELEKQVRDGKPCGSLPVGEYVEIIDVDPATGVFYPPLNLDDHYLLAQDGLEPSVSNPQFHQQMVYAVTMTTINNFERALGRKIQWAEQYWSGKGSKAKNDASRFVQRLRIYPHALRQANAYYDPNKKALLFGYFPAAPANPELHLPGGTVFTCLSHDIIAHETTHALLDGLHGRYSEATHPDTRAFHEAFADIVALFQHFTFPEVLKHQIGKTRGELDAQNLLGQLAQQFGEATGSYHSLRDAIGKYDTTEKKWKPLVPNPDDYRTKMEFHDRGAILVAAVFDAFINIYKQRAKPMLRIATGGSGVLPMGELHPDLVNELASLAAGTADRVLRMCVRALDYCPPVDINFGDYLRAIITADIDMVPDDENGYRVAFIEAFQKRGIYPQGVKSMSEEALCHDKHPTIGEAVMVEGFAELLRQFKAALAYETNRRDIHEKTRQFIAGKTGEDDNGIHAYISLDMIMHPLFSKVTGLLFPKREDCAKLGMPYSHYSKSARFQVDKMWLANRITPDGEIVNLVVLTLLQKRGVVYKEDSGELSFFTPNGDGPADGFVFRGGCTLVFDLDNLCLKYAIAKNIDDKERMVQQYLYQSGSLGGVHGLTYFDETELQQMAGPFAFMHTYAH